MLGGGQGGSLSGRAVVQDGDSLIVEGSPIRLEGIDAPEYSQTCQSAKRSRPCGRMARDHLRGLIDGEPVDCESFEVDRYDRFLAVCRVGGIDLNARMVRDGWAVAFGNYELEEAQASRDGLGLWAMEFDQPRNWRRDHEDRATETVHESASSPVRRVKSWLVAGIALLRDWLGSFMRFE